MPLLNLAIVLIIIGVLLWLVNNYIPTAGSIKQILNIVVVVVVVLWILSVFLGGYGAIPNIRIGR
jgi:hypothetical protein